MARFQAKVVVVTGASSGIGAALARQFASEGATLALLARRKDKLDTLVRELAPSRAIAVACDVTDDASMASAIAEVRAAFGRIDVVIANAGFAVAGNIEFLDIQSFKRQFETNVHGVVRTVLATMPDVIRARGSFVIMGSVAGYIASPRIGAYAMSKAAVRLFSDSLRYEMKTYGVGVTHIAPGFVESDIRKVDNHGAYHEDRPDSLPRWLVFPAARAARQMANAIHRRERERVITGHGKALVFLQRHVPGLLSFVLARASFRAK